MKSKATERSFDESRKKSCVNFNCGTLLLKKRVTITILRARKTSVDCLHNSTIENQNISLGQAIKSARGMPWHQEPTKDVTSCDKLRGGANIL